MTLTGLSFLVLWYGATIGESMTQTPQQLAAGEFRINERAQSAILRADGVPERRAGQDCRMRKHDGKQVIR